MSVSAKRMTFFVKMEVSFTKRTTIFWNGGIFKMDPLFDAEEFFRYSFGVRLNFEELPSLTKLKVDACQRGHFRTLPLYESWWI